MSTCSDPWLFLRFADKRRGHRNEDGRITAPNFSSRRKSKDGVGSCLTRGNNDRILSSIKVEHSDASDPQLKPASQLPKIEIKLYTTKEQRSKPRFITGRNRGSTPSKNPACANEPHSEAVTQLQTRKQTGRALC